MKNQHEVAEQLRQLTRLYINAQKYRIKYGNMFQGKIQYIPYESEEWGIKFASSAADYEKIEEKLLKEIKETVKLHDWSKWLGTIKGVGPIIAGSIIGELDGAIYGSIEKDHKVNKSDLKGFGRKFESTADLWSYAGWGVVDGKAQRKKRGEAASWNKYLKLTSYKFIDSTIKSKGTYKPVYDNRKIYELQNHPEFSKMYIHKRAMRYTIKKFLSDVRYNLILN